MKWTIRKEKDFVGKVWEGDGYPYTIGSEDGRLVCRGAVNGPDTLANANKIAAVPDMLSALYSALNMEGPATAAQVHLPNTWGDLDVKYHFDKIRTAIQIAEKRT